MGWGVIIGRIWIALQWVWKYVRELAVFLGLWAVHTTVVKSLWESAFSKIDGVVTGYSPMTINFQPLAFINTFFPLTEGLSMLSAYLLLVGTSASIRITKAFIDSKKS